MATQGAGSAAKPEGFLAHIVQPVKYLRYPKTETKTLNLSPRESAAKRGYGARWQNARRQFLMLNPLCVDCTAEGRVVAAGVVDHVIPHKGDQELFWDQENWQPLCRSHHSKKTARMDGGFGNRVRRLPPPKTEAEIKRAEKLKKLQAMANQTVSPAEAANAQRQIDKMLGKYNG